MSTLEKLESTLHVKFKNPKAVLQAFVHRSYLNEAKNPIQSNERLEFLGDSILSFVVSKYLYGKYPAISEGELTNLRSTIVKTTTLAETSILLGLGNYLLLSKGEEETGGRQNKSILADCFEALIGSIFIDLGIEAAERIIIEILVNRTLPVIIKERLYIDAKSKFQEVVQEKEKSSPIYKVLKEEGPDHAKIFTIGVFVMDKMWGTGKGKNKHEAEQNAAVDALEKWIKK